jgi:DNA-binding NarL/FixJ family response regulator
VAAVAAVSKPIRVLIVDDDALVRAGLTMLLAGAGDIEIVGEAADGSQVEHAVAERQPDVVLMDIRMPGMDGLAATEILRGHDRPPEIIILTTFDADDHVLRALRAGASGFLLKDTQPADLLTAIRVVSAGDALLAPAITRRLIEEFTRHPEPQQRPAAAMDEITEREREVLTLIGLGLSNTEIASHLHVSLSTAKTHVGHLLTKLGARDRAQLVIAAYNTGLVRPP